MADAHKLKTLRNRRNITVREVEQASRRIADVKGDKRYCISNGWLAQLENGAYEPNICKLFSLSVIYRVNFMDLVRLYNVDVDEREKYERVANPYVTQLNFDNGNGDGGCALSAERSTSLMPESEVVKALEIPVGEDRTPGIIYGHLGLADFTMYPMIQPGALLKIDPRQNKLTSGAWRNEYERPIFFVELRDAYACGWCDLQDNHLLIIPHPLSSVSVRRFTYPRDAEIVGRVVGYSTDCVDVKAQPEGVRKAKAAPAKITSR